MQTGRSTPFRVNEAHVPRLVVALAATMALGTLLGFVYGVLAPFLVADLGLSAFQVGLLPSIMYATGAVAAPALGGLTDRLEARRGVLAMALVVSTAFVVLGLAPAYPVVVVSAVVGGLALSASNPTTNRIVAESVPPGARGAATGWKQSGVAGGALVAGLLLPSAALAWGWRGAVLATAGLSLVAAAGLARWLPHAGPGEAGVVVGTAETVSRTKGLHMYAVAMGMANGAVAAYLVLFATVEGGLRPATAGLLAATMGGISVLARVGWAAGGERTGRPATMLQLIAVVAALAVLAIGASPALGGWALWAGAVLAGLSVMSWQGLLMLAVVLLVPRAGVGAASGVAVRAFYTGYVAGPLLFGLVVDHTAPGYQLAWAGCAAVCVAAAVVGTRMAARARRAG